MSTVWLRFAYVCEFLLAIVAVFTLWSQVGGQGHLDMMPWYWKLSLGCGLSLATVFLTDALTRQTSVITQRSVTWTVLIVLIVLTMAAVTLYYHEHEPVEEPETEDGTTAHILSAEC